MTGDFQPSGPMTVFGPLLQQLDLPDATRREEAAGEVPSRLTAGERALLVELVTRRWQGNGAIIDGGSFLGTSATCLARGVEAVAATRQLDLDRYPKQRPIHAYELGVLPVPADRWAPRSKWFAGQEVVAGESFLHHLEHNLAPHRALIDLHIGDLNAERWDGSPIEIAFIDICKSADLNAHAAREFLPAMAGGASTLIHQDFFFDQLPWIRVTMGHLKDYFRWEGQVADTAVFSCVRDVPSDVVAYDPFQEATLDECLALHDAIDFPGIDRQTELRRVISRSHLMSLKGSKDEALDLLREAAVDYAEDLDAAGEQERYRLDRAVSAVIGSRNRQRVQQRQATNPQPAPAAPSGPKGTTRSSTNGGNNAPGTDQPDGQTNGQIDAGRAAIARQDWDEARRTLAPLVRDRPMGPAAVQLARVELGIGDPGAAIDLLDFVLSKRPGNNTARVWRARAFLDLGDLAAARKDIEEALRRNPDLVAAERAQFDLEVAQRRTASPS